MQKTVLILGASGKVGRHGARAFANAGWQIRSYDRRTDDLNRAAEGADVILNGFNPPNYHDWKTIIPDITCRVIDAARQSGATVLIPGNVYHFGDQPGVWSEKTLPNPVSRKGMIRLEMERSYRQSGVQTIVLRAGNFIDPERRGCVMSTIYLRAIARNIVTLPGDENLRQAMCYLPDWARAAVSLAEMRENLAPFEDIPFPGHTLRGREIKAGLQDILGRELRFARFPWGMLSLLSPFWELARELGEMRYLWQTDHALDDQRLRALLPDFTPTDLHMVLASALPPNLLPAPRMSPSHAV